MKKYKWTDVIITIILIIAIILAYKFYKKNNFNDFLKAEQNKFSSIFFRDDEVVYSKQNSYKIESKQSNDAMLQKEIPIDKNCIYKVSCMVKTENVKTERENSDAGAHLSIADSFEKSECITGTQDWTEINMYFDAKNRESVCLGFRLGGYDGNCTGTAWFSDLKIEEVTKKEDNNWKFACFIIQNIDVNIQNKQIKLSMSPNDIADMRQNMARFQNSCQELSGNQMTVEYDMILIQDEPLTTLSYDEENGYYVAPGDVKHLIDKYLNQKEYDHIFICVRLGDILHKNDIQVNDWIGLRRNGLFRNWIF